MKHTKHAFTLVELIVVITILAILGTIAFLSFQGYSKSSRDGVRVSDVNSMKKSLELFAIQTGKYPLPDNGTPMTYSGGTVWTQGTFGDGVLQKVQKLSKLPVDPLSEVEYTYSVVDSQKEYQIATVLEGDMVSGFGRVYAVGTVGATAYVSGNYNGLITKVLTGGTIYILAVPSIISRDVTETDISNLITSNELVFNGYANLPSSYVNTTFNVEGGFDNNQTQVEIYSGVNLPDQSDLVTFIQELENAYSGTILADTSYIDQVIEANLSADANIINELGAELVNNSLGTEIQTTELPNSCAADPGYTNATFTEGTPALPNQSWQNTNNSNPCYYECINGYTGNDCSTPPVPLESFCTVKGPVLYSSTNSTDSTGLTCDDDIVVCSGYGAGYTMSACDVGATTPGGIASRFQWGRNKPFTTSDNTQHSTQIPNASYDPNNDTYDFVWGSLGRGDWIQTRDDGLWSGAKSQGPCESGYHVPSYNEWYQVVLDAGWRANDNGADMKNKLKMYYTNMRDPLDGNVYGSNNYGYYWSASKDTQYGNNGDHAQYLLFRSNLVKEWADARRGSGMNVRCFKD